MSASSVFAMNTGFVTSLGAYGFEARCEMLRRSLAAVRHIKRPLDVQRAWVDLRPPPFA